MNLHNAACGPGILFTDFYQLTMAQLYFLNGMHTKPVQFDYFFRTCPDYGSHQAGFCIHAGLHPLVAWILQARFDEHSIGYLRNTTGSTGRRTFSDSFLDWLREEGNFGSLSINAIPEGRVVYPQEPLVMVRGNLAMAQLLESSLLNHLNFQTLIATKASRIRHAGGNRPVIEFGLRRAQGEAADAATRAALIGGADFSSNSAISYELGLQPKGTHAHSMVQAFIALGEGEFGAFKAYAESYPDDCLLLVDTVNTLESGVPNAIRVFEQLKKQGHRPLGIRLDSGDLAYLCIQAARMLDKAGFGETVIVLSNNIDEMVLFQILRQIRDEAPRYMLDPQSIIDRLIYGVGTRLITSQGSGALDGVYKLAAINDGKSWIASLKLSETPKKTITPGCKKVWRLYGKHDLAIADVIGLETDNPQSEDPIELHHPLLSDVHRTIRREDLRGIEPLHKEIVRDGKVVYDFPQLQQIRTQRDSDLSRLDPGVRRLINPHQYHVSITSSLLELKRKLIHEQMKTPKFQNPHP